jgi:hypothetical protein
MGSCKGLGFLEIDRLLKGVRSQYMISANLTNFLNASIK